jgi:hypothetical protein
VISVVAPLSALIIFVVSLQTLLYNARVSEFLNSADAEFNRIRECYCFRITSEATPIKCNRTLQIYQPLSSLPVVSRNSV